MDQVEKLAKLMHDAWREKKINENGWHEPRDCPIKKWNKEMSNIADCGHCHHCVAPWEKLTDTEKKLPLMNAEIAVATLNSQKRCPFFEHFPAMPNVENDPATPDTDYCHLCGRAVGCKGEPEIIQCQRYLKKNKDE